MSSLLNRDPASHAKAIAFKNQHAEQEQRLFICVITLAEMQFGLSMYERLSSKLSQTDLEAVRGRIKAAGGLFEPLEVIRNVGPLEQGRLRSKWAWMVDPAEGRAEQAQGVAPRVLER